ncbi:pH-response regulator protein palF/RIM8 [Bienertia sinuspersici]
MSQGSANSRNSEVKCSCGRAAVVRTVNNGANPSTKFYGCPMWPISLFDMGLIDFRNTSCKMFVPVDDKKVVDELQMKLLESYTTIGELEMIQKFNEDRIKDLEKKNMDLLQKVQTLKTELWEQKLEAMRANKKHLSTTLFAALILVVVFYNVN